jgi:hypothetical protein
MVESYHGDIFQRCILRLFGHTHWQHDLITRDEVAFVNHSIEVGRMVRFTLDGKIMTGKVNRVQKRVTVLVKENGPNSIQFSDGQFYAKYYVPISSCTVV